MNKQELEQRFAQYSQEQASLAADIQKKSALVQQLEGKKQLLTEMHDNIVKAENVISVLPDPPKEDEPNQDQTPAS